MVEPGGRVDSANIAGAMKVTAILNAIKWEMWFGDPGAMKAEPEVGVVLKINIRRKQLWDARLIVRDKTVGLKEGFKGWEAAQGAAEAMYCRHKKHTGG